MITQTVFIGTEKQCEILRDALIKRHRLKVSKVGDQVRVEYENRTNDEIDLSHVNSFVAGYVVGLEVGC